MYAYKNRRRPGECSLDLRRFVIGGTLMHVHILALCTAKDLTHPQCPQGYPQNPQEKMTEYRGFCRGYPHYPQVIHKVYPL